MLSLIRLSVLAALREIKNASQIEIIFLKIYSRFFVQGSPETNDNNPYQKRSTDRSTAKFIRLFRVSVVLYCQSLLINPFL